MAEFEFCLEPPKPERRKRQRNPRPQKQRPVTHEGLLFATGVIITEAGAAVKLLSSSTAQLLLPAPAVRLALPAPRPLLLLLAPPPDGAPPAPSMYLSPQGGRHACFVARRRHTHPLEIVEILSPCNAGEFHFYCLLLELCGTDYLASLTLHRDEPFTLTIGRAQLIQRELRKEYGPGWRETLRQDPKKSAALIEKIKKGIKDASRGLTAKKYIDKIYHPDETYHRAITFRVYISHQILKRLTNLGAVYWRVAGKGRILVDVRGTDIKTERDDVGQSE